MHPQVLNDCFQNLIVLLLRRSKIGPSQVLELSYDASVDYASIGVFRRELEASLYQVGHQWLNRDQKDLLVVIKWDSTYTFVLPDLFWPVLMTLDFAMLLQMGKHHNERNSFLFYHAPETLNSGFERSLSCDKKLVILLDGRVDVVGVDVGVIDVFVPLKEAHPRVLNWERRQNLNLNSFTYRALAPRTYLRVSFYVFQSFLGCSSGP